MSKPATSIKHIEPQTGLQFKGVWNVQLFNAETGEKELDHTQDNLIVDNAIVHMAHGVGPTNFNVLHLGNAPFPSTPSTTDLTLNQDFFDAATQHTPLISPGVFSYQQKAVLQTSDAVGTLTEAGLFTSDTVMFNRILFNPQIVKTNQQIAYITTTITIRRV